MLRLLEHKYLIFAICWTVIITFLSLVSFNEMPTIMVSVKGKDKIVHFVFYFIFVCGWFKALNKKNSKNLIIVFFSAVIYGIIIEILQLLFTQTRGAELLDVLANSLGALSALILFKKQLK